MSLSPAAILYDVSGNALASSIANPAGTERALIVRNIPSGTQDVNITTASIAVTGPLTDAQLRASPVPITGSISATNPSVAATAAAVPASATYSGMNVGGNLVGLTGTGTSLNVNLTNTSVAVTGPLTDTQLRATAVPVSLTSTTITGSVAVTNANLDVALSTRLAESTFTTRIPTNGQKTMAGSLPVVIASDQSAIPVNAGSSTVSAANSSTTPLAGNATFTGTSASILGYGGVAVQVFSNVSSATNGLQIQFSTDGVNWNDSVVASFTAGNAAPNDGQVYMTGARGQFVRVVYTNGASAQGSFRIQTILLMEPPAGDTIDIAEVVNPNNHALVTKGVIVGKTTGGGGGYVDVKVNPSGALVGDVSNSTNVGITGSVSVTGAVATTPQTTATATISRTATSNANANILAANANRKGVIVVNDSANVLFIKFGATASATSYTYRVAANGTLEIPFGYTGQIDAILNTGTGNAQVTELTV